MGNGQHANPTRNSPHGGCPRLSACAVPMGSPRQVVGRAQTPLPGAVQQHTSGRKAVGRSPNSAFPRCCGCVCVGRPAKNAHGPTITSKKQPERLRERTRNAKNGAAAANKEDCGLCPSGNGAATGGPENRSSTPGYPSCLSETVGGNSSHRHLVTRLEQHATTIPCTYLNTRGSVPVRMLSHPNHSNFFSCFR